MAPTAEGTAVRRRAPTVEIVFAVVGALVFSAVNVVVYANAYPAFDGGQQNDVRIPVIAIALVLALIAFLGRPGRGFAAGFAVGFCLWSLFLGPYTAPWTSPGGTARRDAALTERVEASQDAAAQRARRTWIAEKRRIGLDESEGVSGAFNLIDCAERFREATGEYPRASDELPMGEQCQGLVGPGYEQTGWRFHYRPIDGGGRVAAYRLTLTPDSALHLAGPIIETRQDGLVTVRATEIAPRLVRGSPLPAIVEMVDPCIRGNRPGFAGDTRAITLKRLVSAHHVRCYDRLPLSPFPSGSPSPYASDPNAAQMLIDDASVERGSVTVAVYVLRYLPRGLAIADGYDLELRPNHYGSMGLRSYLLAADRTIHVTSENRPATLHDPLAQSCESDQRTGCAP